jgi:hypothetical protein
MVIINCVQGLRCLHGKVLLCVVTSTYGTRILKNMPFEG